MNCLAVIMQRLRAIVAAILEDHQIREALGWFNKIHAARKNDQHIKKGLSRVG